MLRRIFAVSFLFWGQSVAADGVETALTDPPVVPMVQAPASDFRPLGNILRGPNAAHGQGGPVRIGGYPVAIAWDHVAVGGTILGLMYVLGSSEAAGGSF